jgi:hypothetical protein
VQQEKMKTRYRITVTLDGEENNQRKDAVDTYTETMAIGTQSLPNDTSTPALIGKMIPLQWTNESQEQAVAK